MHTIQLTVIKKSTCHFLVIITPPAVFSVHHIFHLIHHSLSLCLFPFSLSLLAHYKGVNWTQIIEHYYPGRQRAPSVKCPPPTSQCATQCAQISQYTVQLICVGMHMLMCVDTSHFSFFNLLCPCMNWEQVLHQMLRVHCCYMRETECQNFQVQYKNISVICINVN